MVPMMASLMADLKEVRSAWTKEHCSVDRSDYTTAGKTAAMMAAWTAKTLADLTVDQMECSMVLSMAEKKAYSLAHYWEHSTAALTDAMMAVCWEPS